MSGERDRDYTEEIEGQMQAAQALIESLEEEVASLRQDLEQASVALKAAQEEVAAREEILEERERSRSGAEEDARNLSSAITELRIQASEEQLDLTNQHISELARLQDRYHDQLRTQIEAALSAEDKEMLQEEHRKVQRAAEQEYEERMEVLERSYRAAQERLRESEKEFDTSKTAEIKALREESEEQKRQLERKLREQLEERLEEELRSAAESREEALGAQRKSFDEREVELQREHQSALENQKAEFDALMVASEERIREAEEQHQAKLREIKGLAENREQELRKAHSARLAETKAEAERRIESLQSQREADNRAMRTHHEQDLARLRQQYEERMSEAAERSRLELWTAVEKLEGLKLERTSEAAAYGDRLKELEAARLSEKPDAKDTETPTGEVYETEELPQEELASDEAVRQFRARIEELEEKLSASEQSRETLARELEESLSRGRTGSQEPVRNGHDSQETSESQTDELPIGETGTGDRVRELEARLQEATKSLHQVSDPAHRLRSGISAFNASEHARYVSSISKSLGLPKVHAGVEGDPPGKPVFTFVWEDLAWRRYAADPAEGLPEPRVYLLGGGDEPDELDPVELEEPNARMDARGHIILGVQAR